MSDTNTILATNATVENLDGHRAKVRAEIATEQYQTLRPQAIARIGNALSLPGFRKGKIPEAMLLKQVGEHAVLEEIFELAMPRVIPALFKEHNVQAVGRPRVVIEKLEAGESFAFTVEVARAPVVALPDYKKIAKEVFAESADTTVSEKEIEESIKSLREQIAKMRKHDAAQKEGTQFDPQETIKEEALPAWTDEFVLEFGFKSIDDFMEKLKDRLSREKKERHEDKQRGELVEKLTAAAKVEMPEEFVAQELGLMRAQFEADVARAGASLEMYFKETKKTIEDLEKEWRPTAEKRAQFQIIIAEIAKKENIVPDEKEVTAGIAHIASQEEARGNKTINRDAVRDHVETMVKNREVMKVLEGVA